MNRNNRPYHQQEMFEADRPVTRDPGPLTCLGLTFPNDEQRRKHFPVLLRKEDGLFHRRLYQGQWQTL